MSFGLSFNITGGGVYHYCFTVNGFWHDTLESIFDS